MVDYLNLKNINQPYEKEIKAALVGVVDSGWYLYGKCVESFERQWANSVGNKYCIGCGNGLDALRLVLKAWLEMGKVSSDDEVIVPANTYIASILAISECGLVPVLVEPDEESYLINPDRVEKALTEKTKVIMPVHLYGQMCDMEALSNIAERYGLLVLQDCAQSHGLSYNYGAMAWSFYPSKNLGALGDAGAVTTDDEELACMVRKIANYGSSDKYFHEVKGVNSRMDEFQAAVLSIKCNNLENDNTLRHEIAERYKCEISNPLIKLPVIKNSHVFHVYPILCEKRDLLQQYLKDNGIQTQIHYPVPPHKQSAYREWRDLSFPIAEKIARTELSLPCNQSMSEEEVSYIIKALNNFC